MARDQDYDDPLLSMTAPPDKFTCARSGMPSPLVDRDWPIPTTPSMRDGDDTIIGANRRLPSMVVRTQHRCAMATTTFPATGPTLWMCDAMMHTQSPFSSNPDQILSIPSVSPRQHPITTRLRFARMATTPSPLRRPPTYHGSHRDYTHQCRHRRRYPIGGRDTFTRRNQRRISKCKRRPPSYAACPKPCPMRPISR